MRTLQLIIFIITLTAVSLSAQLSVSEGQSFDIQGTPDAFEIMGTIDVEAGDIETGSYHWELVTNQDVPEGWVYSVCVGDFCYNPKLYNSPVSDSRIIKINETQDFAIYLNPNGVEGKASVEFKLTSADGASTYIAQDFDWNVSPITSKEEIVKTTDFNLYPNPSADYFNISNDRNVAQVSVYTILGKEMFTYNHEEGQAYSVTELQDGIYLARLLDADGKNLKVIRFNKTTKI